MSGIGKALLGLGAAAALIACGGSDDARGHALGATAWTLTIVSPGHGAEVPARTEVEIALSGDAVAAGASPDFDFGFFVDDELVARSRELVTEIELPAGERVLRVEGIRPDGGIDADVLGDEIVVTVVDTFDRGPIDLPDGVPGEAADGPVGPLPRVGSSSGAQPARDPLPPNL